MNEKLQLLVTQSLTQAQEYVQAAGDFVAEQTPILIQEVLNFGLAEAISYWTVWVLLGTLLLVLVVKIFKALDDNDLNEGEFVGCAAIGMVSIGLYIGAFVQTITIFKIVFAPRLYLIEELGKLLK